MIFSEQNSNIASALSKSWGEIETPKHNATVKVQTRTGSSYSFDYTDLTGIFDAAREIFKNNGISIMQNSYTEISPSGLLACVETMFLHNTGEWVKSFPLKFAAATGMQDFGGQITYMKRYSLSAMLGIATEKDDDANGASGNSYQHQSNSNSEKHKYNNSQKIDTPKNATEAAAMVIGFGKHKGKTLRELFKSESGYLKWLLEQDKTDEAIKEGISLMQVAAAQAAAEQKMQ